MSPVQAPESTLPSRPFSGKDPFLLMDRAAFLPRLNARACLVRHRLADHPLLALPRLLELAQWLPREHVDLDSGKVPGNDAAEQIPGSDPSVEESFRRIADGDLRIMLKRIELHPEYRELLHSCLAEIESLGHPCTRGVRAREGYVLISPPNRIIPYHIDPEINFVLQVRGREVYHVLPGDDRALLAEEEIEQFYAGRPQPVTFREEARPRATLFELTPGSGIHLPVNYPHWVTIGDEVTISFALLLQTAGTKRRGTIYAVNHYLRRAGLKPVPFGRSAVRDFLKYQSFRLWRGLRWCLPWRRSGSAH
ncbi:MAG: hypothetical protein JO112_08525 [Planctomycetes bacterium]|nr:hypothetical protein [Planctomycetota bacterium]